MPNEPCQDSGSSGLRLEWLTRVLLLALIAGGAAARLFDFGYPNELTWDEPHFVENARNILEGRSDWNDHPPLGKLLIAAGILALGDQGAGWRLAPLVLGLALIVVAYALGTAAFRSKTAGLYAGAFIAASGFVLAFSKTALLDGMLATTMGAAALALWRARSWRGITLGAVLIGLATSIKFTGIVLVVPLALMTLARSESRSKALGVLALGVTALAAVYAAQFSLGLALAGDEYGPVDVAKKTVELFRHHIGLDDWEHSATSRWYTWFIPLKVVRLHYAQDGNIVRALTTKGNPLLWWGVNLAVLWSMVDLVRRKWRERLEGTAPSARPASGRNYLLLMWFLPLCPWIFTNRDSYIYHYLPSYVFGLVLFGGLTSTLSNPKARLGIVASITLVFAYCVRVWSKIPLDADSLLHAMFF